MIRHEVHGAGRVVRCFVERMPSVFAGFERAVRKHRERVALIFGERRWSFGDLDAEVARVAYGLQAAGITRGDRVGLLLRNRPEFVILFYALQRLGAVAVPMDVRLQGVEVAHVAATCGLALLLHDAGLHDRAAAALRRLPQLVLSPLPEDGPLFPAIDGSAPAPAPAAVEEDDAALILFTSGTTGQPKGATLTQCNIVHSFIHHAGHLGLGADDRVLIALPLGHVSGLICGVVAPLLAGGTLVLMAGFKAEAFLAAARDTGMTVTLMVPAMYNLCLRVDGFNWSHLSTWRIGHFGGAPMPPVTVAALRERLPGLCLVNGYGATETCSPAVMMPRAESARGPVGAVGRAMPCAELLIVDPESGREMARGERGELWVRGPMVFSQYWGDAAATEQALVSGYWRSGDIASIDEAGYVFVHDRLKDMINRGGYKVYSAEVEAVLAACPGVVEAAVVARPDPVLGERVHAFVLLSQTLDVSALAVFCARHLADYKVPESWTLCDAPLPRNANGKLAKTLLRAQLVAAPVP